MNDFVTLKGKTIVVTGAAQGIGRALVEQIVALDGSAVAVDLNAQGLADLKKVSDRIHTYVGDVSDIAFANNTIKDVTEKVGPIHGLVNNAGITHKPMPMSGSRRSLADFRWSPARGACATCS